MVSKWNFKIAASPFKQLYIIQAMLLGKVFPVGYVFLSKKKVIQYKIAFNKLKELLGSVFVEEIILYF